MAQRYFSNLFASMEPMRPCLPCASPCYLRVVNCAWHVIQSTHKGTNSTCESDASWILTTSASRIVRREQYLNQSINMLPHPSSNKTTDLKRCTGSLRVRAPQLNADSSFAWGACDDSAPGVYTRISYMWDWILGVLDGENMGEKVS